MASQELNWIHQQRNNQNGEPAIFSRCCTHSTRYSAPSPVTSCKATPEKQTDDRQLVNSEPCDVHVSMFVFPEVRAMLGVRCANCVRPRHDVRSRLTQQCQTVYQLVNNGKQKLLTAVPIRHLCISISGKRLYQNTSPFSEIYF